MRWVGRWSAPEGCPPRANTREPHGRRDCGLSLSSSVHPKTWDSAGSLGENETSIVTTEGQNHEGKEVTAWEQLGRATGIRVSSPGLFRPILAGIPIPQIAHREATGSLCDNLDGVPVAAGICIRDEIGRDVVILSCVHGIMQLPQIRKAR